MTEVSVLLIITINDLFIFEKCLQTNLFKKPVELKHQQPSDSNSSYQVPLFFWNETLIY